LREDSLSGDNLLLSVEGEEREYIIGYIFSVRTQKGKVLRCSSHTVLQWAILSTMCKPLRTVRKILHGGTPRVH